MKDDPLNALRLAQWAQTTSESHLQRALTRAASPEILSLSLGLPDPELFPMLLLEEAARRVFSANRGVFQYALPLPKLKIAICELMAYRGVECSPDQIFLTMGAQQGLSLLARLLLNPGASIVEEEFSYTGFQQAAEPYMPRIFQIPTDIKTGIQIDALEQLLARGTAPALIYVMADGHNPLGATMPLQNRQHIAQLAREFHVPVIEDDPYGLLEYDGMPIAPIRSLESEWVYYVGSFSKLLAPGLRVGWLVVPTQLIRTLGVIKEASDVNTNNIAQGIILEFIDMGCLPAHLAHLRVQYRARRDAMRTALELHFPSDCKWREPSSGFFFWVELAADIVSNDVLEIALETERVAFLPAEAFSRGCRANGMRLNFSRCDCDRIAEAVGRISRVLKKTKRRELRDAGK